MNWDYLLIKPRVHKLIEGPLLFDQRVLDTFFEADDDIAPWFEGPAGKKLKGGRGKDHPRYGRFVYSFAKVHKPELVVEVGSYAGGTAVGWARAMKENGRGRIICVDMDVYSRGTFPELTAKNIHATGFSEERLELLGGNSRELIPRLSEKYTGQVDIYLVDGDHTYEGALADLENGRRMMRRGGYILVHDVDPGRRMDEMTDEHPAPVLEAMRKFAADSGTKYCVVKFIRKHLGILRIE